MQTSEGRKALLQHLGPLDQEYIEDFLSGDGKNKIIDTTFAFRQEYNLHYLMQITLT